MKALGASQEIDVDIFEVEQRAAEELAKSQGFWIPMMDVFDLGVPGPSGNENDTYVELMQRLPDVGNRVLTELGEGRVRSINMISETLMVEYKDTIRKHDASEIIKILDRKVKKEEIAIDPDQLKELID